jgi:hypothetical protein
VSFAGWIGLGLAVWLALAALLALLVGKVIRQRDAQRPRVDDPPSGSPARRPIPMK